MYGLTLSRTFQKILDTLQSFYESILFVFTEPLDEIIQHAQDTADATWVTILTEPLQWIVQAILPEGGTLLGLMFEFGATFLVVFALARFFSK